MNVSRHIVEAFRMRYTTKCNKLFIKSSFFKCDGAAVNDDQVKDTFELFLGPPGESMREADWIVDTT